ncbi:hypothetical protein ACWDA3_52385 [Nonomuraea rubra]
MRKILIVLAALQVGAVLVQFYLATFGAFHRPQPAPMAGPIVPHIINGTIVIPVLSLVIALVAAAARAGGRLVGLALVPVGVVVAQLFVVFPLAGMFGEPGVSTTGSNAVLGFHAVLGLVLLWAVVAEYRGARALVRQAGTGAAVAPAGR